MLRYASTLRRRRCGGDDGDSGGGDGDDDNYNENHDESNDKDFFLNCHGTFFSTGLHRSEDFRSSRRFFHVAESDSHAAGILG